MKWECVGLACETCLACVLLELGVEPRHGHGRLRRLDVQHRLRDGLARDGATEEVMDRRLLALL